MLNRKSGAVSFVVGVMLAVGSVYAAEKADTKAEPKKNPAAWSAKMQGLYQTLAELATNTSSDKRFNDPSLKKTIQAQADRLASFAHQLGSKTEARPDLDPTLQLLASLLADETKEAAQALKMGHRDYARSILRNMPAYCISCHTRNASGPQFKELALEPMGPSLGAFDKGEFYAATRQYDRALAEFNSIIKDSKSAENDHWTWKRTVEEALAIAIRTKKDPKLAESIADAVIATQVAPQYIREDAKKWKKSIQEWIAEKPIDTQSADSLRMEAMRLLAKAKEMQSYMMDRSADVYYLRASAAAHDLLQVAKEAKVVGDGLFMAGLTYEVLAPLKRNDIHQFYYAACIRKQPHTELSDICYRRYEENVILGYTGSGGTSVPESVKEKLNRLEALSAPFQATPEPRK